ncbi:MAG: beta-lactamase family protein [Phaeodactylibacter sp.]|nr:beta-lactamase family protein [Phaeodactylibacter sp.]MCB9273874.1 beta-lactamase family protein [Lewinellaceae bacterium]
MQNLNRRTLFAALMFCLIYSHSTAQADDITSLVEEIGRGLPDGVELSIGLIDDGRATKLGYRIEGQRPVAVENADKIFEIGSVTKTFTAALIVKLAEEGKMPLSAPIQAYLPVQMARDSFEGHTITVEHLLMHTSGLSESPYTFTLPYLRAKLFSPKNPNRNFKARHYYKYLSKFELDYLPGEQWDYNNAAYGLLGEFAAMQYGLPWEEAVRQYLFEPLKMQHSYFRADKQNKDQFVTGITAKGKKARLWEMDLINPAGAIKSTLNDMLLYASAQLSPPSDSLAFLAAAHNPVGYQVKMPEGSIWHGNAMGLGWWHNLEGEGPHFIWHGGGTGGYSAFIGFSKERNRAVVVLANISGSHPLARAENRIPKPILLGQALIQRG